ncbi:MAG TPA: hypothetical protein VKD72_19285 [Gemmataceae bacterium]|nr:hypothetical protein [Gemmataceae bacterium]
MKRRLMIGFVLAAALGCQLSPDQQDTYRPLREHGPRLNFDDLVSRARRQADLALAASYNDNWGDLQDLAIALRQTAELLPSAADAPDLKKAEDARKAIGELSRDATRLTAAAKEVTRLTGREKENKIKEMNDLLIGINKAVRILPRRQE